MNSQPDAWQGGDAAFAERKRIIEETKDDLESGDHAKRVAALCALASAHYSCAKHARGGDKIGLLAQAKTCLDGVMDTAFQYRLRENGSDGDGVPLPLTADQCDVLSTIALRSIKVLGLAVAASNPRLAVHFAHVGLQRCTDRTTPHTVALLHLDRAEGLRLLGRPDVHEAMDCAHDVLRAGIPDERQRVRVLKRLGTLYITERGDRQTGGKLLKEAWELAERVAPGQLESINQIVRHLRRSRWHPMKWLITVT